MKLRGPGPPETMLLLGSILIVSHLNIIVGGPFKLIGKIKLRGPGPLDQYYCWGPIYIGHHLNIIVWGLFKLVSKHEIERARAPWINIIVGGPFKLGAF